MLFSNDSFANFKFNLLTIERYKNDLCLLCASCIYRFPPKKRLTNDKKKPLVIEIEQKTPDTDVNIKGNNDQKGDMSITSVHALL